MSTRVLDAYATHHGATRGIVERIATTLSRFGLEATARSVTDPGDLDDHDAELVKPRDHHIFFGAYDPTAKPIGMLERITRATPATRDVLPAGGFRDWDEIDAWARAIADELTLVPVGR